MRRCRIQLSALADLGPSTAVYGANRSTLLGQHHRSLNGPIPHGATVAAHRTTSTDGGVTPRGCHRKLRAPPSGGTDLWGRGLGKASQFSDAFRLIAVTVALVIFGFQVGVLEAVGMFAALVLLDLILHRPEWLRPGVFVLAILACFVGVYATKEGTADKRFYEATAQVVPAVFIALAVQIQAFH